MNALMSSGPGVRFPHIGKVAILMFLLLGALPGQVFAQLSCNPFLEIEIDEFPSFYEGDPVPVRVEIGAGPIGGGSTLTISKFQYGTDCAEGEFCTSQGNTVSYVPGSVTTTCENPVGTTIQFAEPAPGLILEFVPDNPIVQAASTSCLIEFELKVDSFVGSPPPRNPSLVFQGGGWLREDGECDNELFTSGSGSTAFAVNKSAILLEKSTNGVDADTPAAGPQILAGDPVVWEYMVTNTGNLPLVNVAVVDDQGVVVTCSPDVLDLGASTICTAPPGVAQPGPYANIGTVSGIPVLPDPVFPELEIPAGSAVTDTDPSHYLGLYPDFEIVKSSPQYPGPLDEPGTVFYSYMVTNTGNMELTSLALSDTNTASAPVCISTTLPVGGFTTCTATHEFTEEELDNGGNEACGLYNLVTATVAEINGTRQDELCIPVRLPGEAIPVLSNLGLLLMASLLLFAGLITRRIT